MKHYNQPICPKCGSKTIIYRITTNDYLCKRCGELTPKSQIVMTAEECRQKSNEHYQGEREAENNPGQNNYAFERLHFYTSLIEMVKDVPECSLSSQL